MGEVQSRIIYRVRSASLPITMDLCRTEADLASLMAEKESRIPRGTILFMEISPMRFTHIGLNFFGGDEMNPIIQVEHFAKKYGNFTAVDDISFTVEPGKTVGIMGATGAGKSSLIYLLQRLYAPTEGQVCIDGMDVADIRGDYLRRHVGIVLQEPFLFSRTIGENIALGDPSATQEERFDAARTACVHDVIQSFAEGYDTMVGERGVTLSGGQKQRVAIARMLVQKTPICIFDDSLSAVDAETDAAIREALLKRDTGTTILISHRISTLRGADTILVLENGSIVQRGSHQELVAQEGLYRRICTIQNELDEAMEGGVAV